MSDINRKSYLFGIFFAFCSYFCSSLLAVCTKWVSHSYPITEILFFRFLFSLIVAVCLIKVSHKKWHITSYRLHLHFFRFLLMAAYLALIVYSMSVIPLVDFTVLSFTITFFVFLVSGYFLKEKIGLHRVIAVTICFVGVMIMLQPGTASFSIGGATALFSVFLMACNQTLTKYTTFYEDPLAIVYYVSLLGTVIFAFFSFNGWYFPNVMDLFCLFILGSASFLMQYFMGQALYHVPSVYVSPIGYSMLLWSSMFGYLIWGEVPTENTLYGASIIISAGLYIIIRDAYRTKSLSK